MNTCIICSLLQVAAPSFTTLIIDTSILYNRTHLLYGYPPVSQDQHSPTGQTTVWTVRVAWSRTDTAFLGPGNVGVANKRTTSATSQYMYCDTCVLWYNIPVYRHAAMAGSFSGALKLTDLDDFITPSQVRLWIVCLFVHMTWTMSIVSWFTQECVKPVKVEKSASVKVVCVCAVHVMPEDCVLLCWYRVLLLSRFKMMVAMCKWMRCVKLHVSAVMCCMHTMCLLFLRKGLWHICKQQRSHWMTA